MTEEKTVVNNVTIEEAKPKKTEQVKKFWKNNWKKIAAGAGLLAATAGGVVFGRKLASGGSTGDYTDWTDDDGRDHVSFVDDNKNVEVITSPIED